MPVRCGRSCLLVRGFGGKQEVIEGWGVRFEPEGDRKRPDR